MPLPYIGHSGRTCRGDGIGAGHQAAHRLAPAVTRNIPQGMPWPMPRPPRATVHVVGGRPRGYFSILDELAEKCQAPVPEADRIPGIRAKGRQNPPASVMLAQAGIPGPPLPPARAGGHPWAPASAGATGLDGCLRPFHTPGRADHQVLSTACNSPVDGVQSTPVGTP